MGRRPGPVDERRAADMRSSFGPPLEALAERIGVAIDRVEAKTEVAVASRRVTIAAGDIEAGCIAAERTTVDGWRVTTPTLVPRHLVLHRRARRRLAARRNRLAGDREGDAPLKVDVAFPIEPDQLGAMTPGLTASRGQLGGGGLRSATRRADERRPRR